MPPNDLFRDLSAKSLQHLLSHAHTSTYKAHEQIVRQGEKAEWLYLILEGQVKTVRYSSSGEESTLRMLRQGDTFMDAIIFMEGVSPVHAVATETSLLLCLPAVLVQQHVLVDPQFASNLLHIVTSYYKNALLQIDSIRTKTPLERLGAYFLRLHLEQGPAALSFDLSFPKSLIANHLGMTPETFSRAQAEIKKKGVTIEQKHIGLNDSFGLCDFCDSDIASTCPRFGVAACPYAVSDASPYKRH